jgi:DNA primase
MTDHNLKRLREEILTAIVDHCCSPLAEEAAIYLKEGRGFNDEIIKKQRLGYNNGTVTEYLLNTVRYAEDICIELGVLAKNNGKIWDPFNGRIIIPTLYRGRVVYITGRAIGNKDPRYWNIKGEKTHLYNEEALSNEEVFLVESSTDCISLLQHGYPAIATFGTAGFNNKHVNRFSKCERIYLYMHDDEAGREAEKNIVKLLIQKEIRLVTLPREEGIKDINDYFKVHKREDFDALVVSAKDAISSYIEAVPADTDKKYLSARLEFVLGLVALKDKATQQAYLRDIASRFNLNRHDIDAYRSTVNALAKEERENGNCVDEIKQEKEIRAIFPALIELVEDHGKVLYAIKENDAAEIRFCDEYKYEGKVYIPPTKEQLPDDYWLPSKERILELIEETKNIPEAELNRRLFNEIELYLRDAAELLDDDHYTFVAAFIPHTYLLELVGFTPIIVLFGDPEKGKSRIGKAIIYASHRGKYLDSFRPPSIIRTATDLGEAIFIDVENLDKKLRSQDAEDIILHRFEKGAKTERIVDFTVSSFLGMKRFRIFGVTIIATNTAVGGEALNSRSIPIDMPETDKIFETPVYPEAAFHLKEQLFLFRARYMWKKLPDVKTPAKGRLGDIMKPILQIVRLMCPEREDSLMEFIYAIRDKRLSDKRESFQAKLIMVVMGLRDKVENGRLSVEIITDAVNAEKEDDKFHFSIKTIGRQLRGIGFRRLPLKDNKAAIAYDLKEIVRFGLKYGVRQLPETPITPE